MMDAAELIEATAAGRDPPPAALRAFIRDFVGRRVPDYQMAAWLMAVRWRGLSPAATWALTRAYGDGGRPIAFSADGPPVVDKHSTGGVGDKASLIAVPLAAACGLRVAKMSGRGLGLSGGTIDKLESLPGLTTALTPEAFAAQVNRTGLAIAGHSGALTPGDARTYALRDVTGTVPSIPLIAASIVSKKLALKTDAVVLDVKAGSGAFMPTVEEARKLATVLLDLLALADRPARAAITSMDQPLGRAVGHSLEVSEALEVLQGEGDQRVRELSIALVEAALQLTGRTASAAPADRLRSGAAYEQFAALVAAQGGNLAEFVRAPAHASVEIKLDVRSRAAGTIGTIDAAVIAQALRRLGGVRRTKRDDVDRAVGVALDATAGDEVAVGERLAVVYARRGDRADAAADLVRDAFDIQRGRRPAGSAVLEWVEAPKVA